MRLFPAWAISRIRHTTSGNSCWAWCLMWTCLLFYLFYFGLITLKSIQWNLGFYYITMEPNFDSQRLLLKFLQNMPPLLLIFTAVGLHQAKASHFHSACTAAFLTSFKFIIFRRHLLADSFHWLGSRSFTFIFHIHIHIIYTNNTYIFIYI